MRQSVLAARRHDPRRPTPADFRRSLLLGFAPFLAAACASTSPADPPPAPAHIPIIQAVSQRIADRANVFPTIEPPNPAHTTCAYWGTQVFFRQASLEDVGECLGAGADPNGPPGQYPLPSLFVAAGKTPHPAIISALVAVGADVGARTWDGLTPLHEAAYRYSGHVGVIAALVEAGVDPNARDRDGVAPLHLAAIAGNPAVVAALVEAGADPNLPGPFGQTPLEVVRSHGPDDFTRRYTVPVVRELVRLGARGLGSEDLDRIASPTYCGYWHTSSFRRAATPEDYARCLEEGADVFARDQHGNTALHGAASLDAAVTARLLAFGAYVNAPNSRGTTPLHNAVSSRNPATVTALLEAGADIDAAEWDGDTPLQKALRRLRSAPASATELALQLLEAGANANQRGEYGDTPLYSAAEYGGPTLVGALLEAGADPSALTEYGESAIDDAAASAEPEVIRLLVAAGAEVNNRSPADGSFPLHKAVAGDGAYLRVAALLEAGANPDVQDAKGDTPLQLAASGGDTAVVSLGTATFFAAAGTDIVTACLEAGADPNPWPRMEYYTWPTLLHLAAVHAGDSTVISALVRAGTDVHVRDRFGHTPLHDAAEFGTPAAVRALLRAGADPGARVRGFGPSFDSRGDRTPLHLAASNPNPDVAALLIAAGAHVNAPERRGGTPLHTAARNPNSEVAKVLLEAGANANARMFNGVTPLHLAAGNPNPEVPAVLLEAGADPNTPREISDWSHWRLSGNLTPLYWTAPDNVATLVAAGADVDGRGTLVRIESVSSPAIHLSPLYLAVYKLGHPAVIEALARAGADLELADDDGRTVLHRAAMWSPHLFPLLLRLGADPEARDVLGKTPMDYARENEALWPWERVKMSTPVDKR